MKEEESCQLSTARLSSLGRYDCLSPEGGNGARKLAKHCLLVIMSCFEAKSLHGSVFNNLGVEASSLALCQAIAVMMKAEPPTQQIRTLNIESATNRAWLPGF